MTEAITKQSEKTSSVTVQTVRVPQEVMRKISHRLVDSGESFQGLVMRLIEEEMNPSISPMVDGGPEDPDLKGLRYIKEHAREGDIAAIGGIIRAFQELAVVNPRTGAERQRKKKAG